MRHWMAVILLLECSLPLLAGDVVLGAVSSDTVWTHVDTVYTMADDYAGAYADTIRLHEQQTTVDVDALLLQLVAQQGQYLHTRAIDSLLIDFVSGGTAHVSVDSLTVAQVFRRDSILQAERFRQDSILQAEWVAYQQHVRDSIEFDSLRQINAHLEETRVEVPVIITRKSLIKDTEEDRQEQMRVIRNQYTRWRKEATVLLQLTQNYATPNWYQGGSASFAMLGIAKGLIGYYGDKFTWENTGEFRQGHTTVQGDSLRKINTTDDLLKLYSKAGYKVYDKLYVSASGEFEMHFSPIYKANTLERKSGFASPIRLNLALGVDYKPVKGLSLVFSPFAYKMVYVNDTIHIKQTELGVPIGQKLLSDAGSSLRVEYVWKPVREVALESKFYMYTNYKMVELDLEINCDFIINRFFSARVMLHPRFDSSIILEGDNRAKMQFKELISVGFAHKFH